jgi:hypothetical protein
MARFVRYQGIRPDSKGKRCKGEQHGTTDDASRPALANAAAQAQDHLPTQLPPTPQKEVPLPDAARDHISDAGLADLPNWVFGTELPPIPHKDVAISHLPDWLIL